ncbi:MAG TPA: YncE family protein, partial [Usitatibacter sp.]|nr:YncE family protein [Usitatibacter sp.]
VTTVPGLAAPAVAGFDRSGTRLYVSNIFGGVVAAMDPATNAVVAPIVVGALPVDVVASPTADVVYIIEESGSVDVISTATNTVTATIALPGGGPEFGAVTPTGARLYVPDPVAGQVYVIDAATNTVAATIAFPVGASPFDVVIDAAGAFAYVTDQARDLVAVIDIATNTVVGSIAVGAGPGGIALGAGPAPPVVAPPRQVPIDSAWMLAALAALLIATAAMRRAPRRRR